MAGITEDQEQHLNKLMFGEYTAGQANRQAEFADFEANLDIVECKRTEKDYDWLSDVFIPEAPSIMLTEASYDAMQYFQSRDYVDVFLEGSSQEDLNSCKAAKKLINKSLNNRHVYHYMKYMQAREINRLIGYVYALCWWEQDVEKVKVGVSRYPVTTISENYELVHDVVEEPIEEEFVVIDRFNWMPIDPRNVFTDNQYCYSAQDESWIIIRSEKSYQELLALEKTNNYINLDRFKEVKPPNETDTSAQSYNKDDKYMKAGPGGKFDILERYGKQWVIVTEKDDLGNPTAAVSGYGEDGEPLGNAEFILVRQTMAYKGNQMVLIRFQPEPLRDALGRPYMPIIRGLSYIHATKKNGMSDAKYLRELQVACNDTINLSNDRVKLATLPTFIGNRSMVEDNDTIYIEPEHTIEVEDPNQFHELPIRDNIQGAMQQFGLFRGAMQQVTSVYPSTMGDPGSSDITATAVAGADARSNIRNSYKSLSFEYTFLCELYWMILQMAWQFMHVKTAHEIFEEDEIKAFNPVGDYTYKPVTSNIEQEYSKRNKVKEYDQIVGRLVGLAPQNPAIIPLIATIVGRQMELLGDEFRTIEPLIKRLASTPMTPEQPAAPQQPGQAEGALPMDMTSNQTGLPVSAPEADARSLMQ